MALSEEQKKERSEYLNEHLKITKFDDEKQYVFISYASDNWEVVFKNVVVPLQEQYGLRVYADKAFDHENNKWTTSMLRNILYSDLMIAFFSQKYIESYACFLELLTAVNNKKQIVFVFIDNDLRNGDTADKPVIESNVKKEIHKQGNVLTIKTDNTSNDIMRAMVSAYTNISSLLQQDSLSKYDISDAFINFLRDASINQKNIYDMNALKNTIMSVSESVFAPVEHYLSEPEDNVQDIKEIASDPMPENTNNEQEPAINDKIIGKCPFCGKNVYEENEKYFSCEDEKEGCKFKIWKHSDYYLTDITRDLARTLLEGKPVTRVEKKNNSEFEYVLDKENGKLIKVFYGKCHVCGKNVYEHEKDFSCNGKKDGCVKIWKHNNDYRTDITRDLARTLLEGKTIKLEKINDGKIYETEIILDPTTGSLKQISK